MNKLQKLGAGAVALILGLIPVTAAAQSACTIPVQPVCSTGVMANDTDSGKLRCESDIAKYIQDLEGYRGCLDAADKRAQQQVEQAKRFRECMKEGRKDCAFDSRR